MAPSGIYPTRRVGATQRRYGDWSNRQGAEHVGVNGRIKWPCSSQALRPIGSFSAAAEHGGVAVSAFDGGRGN